MLILIAQFYVAVWPIGSEPNAQSFFEAYLAVPIIAAFYIFWKVYKGTRWVSTMDIDLVSGRRELNLAELKAQEKEEQATWKPWKRFRHYRVEANVLGCITGFVNYSTKLTSELVILLGIVYVVVKPRFATSFWSANVFNLLNTHSTRLCISGKSLANVVPYLLTGIVKSGCPSFPTSK